MPVLGWMIALGLVGAIITAIGMYLMWGDSSTHDGPIDDIIALFTTAFGLFILMADAIWFTVRWLLSLD